MKLQGRTLSNGTQGDDVRLLHHELSLLGFRLIPDSETHPGIFGSHTLMAVRELQAKAGLKVTGIVDESTAKAISARLEELSNESVGSGPFRVHGRVATAAGAAVAGATIRAFDRDLRNEELLGTAITDAAGLYDIHYGPESFSRVEKGNADLVVKAFAADGRLLAISSILFNAGTDATVDVPIPAEVLPPPTLFDAIRTALQPLLGGLKAADLEEDDRYQDLTFLSGETGFKHGDLARFALAHKLAQQAIRPEFWFPLVGGSVFRFTESQSLAAQLTAFLDSLPSLDAATVHKALARAFNLKEISESFRREEDTWIKAFLAFVAQQLVSGDGKPTFVKLALEDAGITDPRKQEVFARLFNEHKALTPGLIETLEKDLLFKKEEVADLRTSFQLADLTQADFSIVKMLKDEHKLHRPEDIRSLAKKSEDDWVSLVTERYAAGDIKLPFEVGTVAGKVQPPVAEIYGKTLDTVFREAFPTTAFAGGLERALQNGGVHGLQHAETLRGFLEDHEDFELLNTPVDEFLKDEDDAFRLEVKAVQRVFKLAPRFEAADALLADNVHSAQQIYRMGETEFVRSYGDRKGFTKESARLTWNQAADTYAATITLLGDLQGLSFEALPWVLQNNNQELSKFPNWNQLFQGGDLCECEHCRSVLSPAAYFADLLMFLKERKTGKPGFASVKQVLFDRRLDLGYLELNCENALTPLPYVDVVCEVLEDVIAAGENDLELPGFTAMPADAAAAKAAVSAALSDAPIGLGANFSLSQVDPADPDRWVVHGDGATWLLKKKATPNFYAEILRNTKASAAELRAYPQYVNPKAYEKLRAARYPMTLPLDLFAEEVRAAVRKTNLKRWDLMRTLRGPAAPNNPTDVEVAAEYFGISVDSAAAFDEKRLILVADATEAGQQTVWGETGNVDWLDTVGVVRNFLRKTGLEYNELLELLDLEFINPDGDIAVYHLDPSCDLDKKVIQILDAQKLDRIHRFLRLWRKLKSWTTWELDLVIRHPRVGNGALDEAFLVNLLDFSEVKARLGGKTTVEQVLALLGDLNVETHFTRPHEKRADGLYQRIFLNRRLLQPLDSAFEVANVTGPTTETIDDHQSVVLAALGIREADLTLLRDLNQASDDAPDLTLANLSFLWRHAWLSKQLKLKAADWKVVLKIFNQVEPDFANPGAALAFVERIRLLKATGFTPDEINWLLAADRSAKAAVKEKDAARFLTGLRKELQSIQAKNTVSLPISVEDATIDQASTQLGLTPALTRLLFTRYALLPDTLLTHFTGSFAATTDVVSESTMKATFDGWYWATRVAAIWKKWKITPEELERILILTPTSMLLNFLALPLDATGTIAPFEEFLRLSRLLKLRDSLPETGITLLEVLEKLNAGSYTQADFAADAEGLNDAWRAADMKKLVDSLDLVYPGDYLLAENWERLRRAFSFLDNLNAGAETVMAFAAPTMSAAHARTLKELLRSKFGTETWLILCAEIQDVLRERKRDALAAYLLVQDMPADAPSDKWENTNDLYSYYLLDVEMGSCQLTSRLVQGSGSVQLFVQRCFMGLEPHVTVQADGAEGDSAWRWWKWMRKYRVWEANRKVFLWPENWIESELRKDKSPFFKDLENELLQNEVNLSTVETAFSNYLEKLDGVAQLEIAGFYQEDDGDNAIVHVFGRTRGAEPYLYYYRRYDYRQWTPWEKVELDIQCDYLIPAVVNRRLFLLWPVFTEVTLEEENFKEPQKPWKQLELQMAISQYRRGKWTPKKLSRDRAKSHLLHNMKIVKDRYRFFAIDRSKVDGRFGIVCSGNSTDDNKAEQAYLSAEFELASCKGVPEIGGSLGNFAHAVAPESVSAGAPTLLKWVERPFPNRLDYPDNDLTLANSGHPSALVLQETPWIFHITPPWQLSYMDQLFLDGFVALGLDTTMFMLAGSWLPFFYNDKRRTFFVLPVRAEERTLPGHPVPVPDQSDAVRSYYPDIRREVRTQEDYWEKQMQDWAASLDFSTWTDLERQQWEDMLAKAFPEEPLPPYTDDQLRQLSIRLEMRPTNYSLASLSLELFWKRHFHFKNFYHPFACDFAKLVSNPLKGIPALMSRETQLKDSGFSFFQVYKPTWLVLELNSTSFYPREVVDFTPDGAYSSYNWELFFHVPLLIANLLSKNQRFEEARDWYHFIFNPIGVESATPGSPTSKYWITKPFYETTDPQYVQQRIENILHMLAGDTNVPGYSPQLKIELENQVLDWRNHPFEPHRIASSRTVAYQKTVVMKYLDNLIAWGDHLFRQDSMESINEATQLYILAAEILGPRPKKIPPPMKPPVESFNEMETQLDKFSNALIQVENLIPPLPGDSSGGSDSPWLPTLYFCIPHNEKLLSYWDTVSDRLYKIRHCMNIEGVVRQLALFEPPIDPGLLVKAVAAGLDISAVLADLNTPLPLYRFNLLLQKANEVCNDVKALGSALLAALEKKDAEALNLLRQGQEIRLLEAVKAVREKQIEEAQENLDGVRKNKELAEIKKRFYESREFLSAGESAALMLSAVSLELHTIGTLMDGLGAGLAAIPNFIAGTIGVIPVVTAESGGSSASKVSELVARSLYQLSAILDKTGSIVTTMASYKRRMDDWHFQKNLAIKEIEQIDESIAAAELRIAIAEKELENQILQIENAKATDEFLRSKFTNEELYQWQVGQISGVYFQSYKLAYDLAKRAERCFRFELGLQDSSYIQFGYWDSLKKGLLSGEKLQYDLRRLETAYLEQNRREFELTKQVSLALLDPLALVKLRETGRCFFRLPEEIFDLDYPGHYFRRIKSVSLTLPCVVGPYTTISCTLRLLKNSLRINANAGDDYPRNSDDSGLPADDDRFVETNIPVKAIAASNAQNDSGMFELSFRDERYLPFEGAGVISEWSLELFSDLPANNPKPEEPDFGEPLRQFDYGTLSDAILHVRYTAREDAGPFKNSAISHLRAYFGEVGATPSLRLFNLRQEFPSQWHRFLNPVNPANGNVFELEMSPGLFPIRDAGKTMKIDTVWLLARCADTEEGEEDHEYEVVMTPPLPEPLEGSPPPPPNQIILTKLAAYGGLHSAQKDQLDIAIAPTDPAVTWQMKMTRVGSSNLLEDEVQDLLLVLGYAYEWP